MLHSALYKINSFDDDASSSQVTITRDCGPESTSGLGLRIGAIFIIWATSLLGTLGTCIMARNGKSRRVIPEIVFDIFKYFGSGVILTTSIIHLLEPAADDEIGVNNIWDNGGCIPNSWGEYPYAFGICLASLFCMFVVELFAFRIGLGYLNKLNTNVDIQNDLERVGSNSEPIEGAVNTYPPLRVNSLTQHSTDEKNENDEKYLSAQSSLDNYHDAQQDNPASVQFVSVMALEFGVLLHSVIIGLTLGTASDQPDDDSGSNLSRFDVLFIVIIFHQMFEGIGLGSRLGFLELPKSWNWVPYVACVVYSIITPIGLAGGIGARNRLSMSSGGANIVSGVMDSVSAGVLLYTATVELIAHEFIFNQRYLTLPWYRVLFSLFCFAAGALIMAVLGKWA